MTYFGFLLRFLFLPILVFLASTIWDNRKNKQVHGFRNGGAVWMGIGIHVLLAVAYTTPWDNYLVATGVWYYNPSLVTGLVLGYGPIEEYTFFVSKQSCRACGGGSSYEDFLHPGRISRQTGNLSTYLRVYS